VVNLFAVFLGARALAGIGLKGNDNLVHQIFVIGAAKDGFRRFKF
jgi:hypothetical protein